MKIQKLSIMAVCVTRMQSNGDRVIHEGYRLIYSGGEQVRHGVAFLLEPSIAQFVEKVMPINKRVIGADLKLMDGVSMIQVYALNKVGQQLKNMNFINNCRDLWMR